ncbi:hypothetical protein HOC32_04605 [Candidatus Woesearchaeota archaeon]|nr:hypothetical protein [Candidatus Woesearchaeota archaeon]
MTLDQYLIEKGRIKVQEHPKGHCAWAMVDGETDPVNVKVLSFGQFTGEYHCRKLFDSNNGKSIYTKKLYADRFEALTDK